MKNLPKLTVDKLQNIMDTESDRQIPLQERLEKENKKLSNELMKYIKI
jgi:hypothetical protein